MDLEMVNAFPDIKQTHSIANVSHNKLNEECFTQESE
jgi:hypothetical protein